MEQPEYQSRKDFAKALTKTFLGLDEMIMSPQGMEAMITISKEHPNQTSPVERALRFHADSKFNLLFLDYLLIWIVCFNRECTELD